MDVATARCYATLARWLGPWAPAERAPAGVRRDTLWIDAARPGAPGRRLEAWVYRSGSALGTYVIAPGLHFRGPADPRMDRFCRVLAAAGFVVVAPFVPDYIALQLTPAAIDDFTAVFVAARALPDRPAGAPGVFSVSFGSLLALRLAASEAQAGTVGGVIVFGGYADWNAVVQFCLTGATQTTDGRPLSLARDPLNQPVVFMNLLEQIGEACVGDERVPRSGLTTSSCAALRAAWRGYVEAVWGRPEMKERARFEAVARQLAAAVPAPLQALFLCGCGVVPGGDALCRAALARRADAGYLDPRPHLGAVRCPVTLVHGVDDDVIPYTQAAALAAALPVKARCRVYLTGLYGHTRRAAPGSVRVLLSELATLARVLGAIVATAQSSLPGPAPGGQGT